MMREPTIRQLLRPLTGIARAQSRPFLNSRSRRPDGRAFENLNLRRMEKESQDYYRLRQMFLVSGAIAGTISILYTVFQVRKELGKGAKLDSALPSTDPLTGGDASKRQVVVHDDQGREIVPTGNSVVPSFPRTISLPSYTAADVGAADRLVTNPSPSPDKTEYTLVGLGLRTVSFLNIGVYVFGYYIATADIAAFQDALVKRINPIATTLVPGERDRLRAALLDPTESEQIWTELLARGVPARSAFRIVPVRDTDFHHLRDGFVRAIQMRGPESTRADDGFGEAMRHFRALFNRGSVPKRKELLMMRDAEGIMAITYDDGGHKKEKRFAGVSLIGIVEDKRITDALWLNYLAGKKVASEPARRDIVEGITGFVERPVGTVATQVV